MNAHAFTAFRPKLSIVIVAIALAVMLVAAAGAVRQTSDVQLMVGSAVVGTANLVRTDSGVSMRISSSVEGDLIEFPPSGNVPNGTFMPGDAVTNWFVVFNNPGGCSNDECGENDILDSLLGGDPNGIEVDLIFATGHVAGRRWNSAASLSEGDTTGSINPLFGAPAVGLIDAMTAEIHLIVRVHGPAGDLTPEDLAAAISTVGGGCGTNTCGDAQFAIFLAP